MAIMYPRTLAENERITRSEVKVFDAVRDGLDDEWDAYHSVGWMARDHAEGSKEGEIDMVLVHPEEGVLCLEVKGEGVECIGGEWFRSFGGKRERTKDPFKQAADHTHALHRKLKEADAGLAKSLAIDPAVAFPMVTIHQLALAPDAPREILIDRNELKEPAKAIERVLAYHRGSRDKAAAISFAKTPASTRCRRLSLQSPPTMRSTSAVSMAPLGCKSA